MDIIFYVLIGAGLLATVAWSGKKAGERDVKRIRAAVYGVGPRPKTKRVRAKNRQLPLGYELNTRERSRSKRRAIVPTFMGVPISDGYDIVYAGYRSAVKRARGDIFDHYDNNVDVKNV